MVVPTPPLRFATPMVIEPLAGHSMIAPPSSKALALTSSVIHPIMLGSTGFVPFNQRLMVYGAVAFPSSRHAVIILASSTPLSPLNASIGKLMVEPYFDGTRLLAVG